MFSVGHLAFGYLSGRTSSKLLNVKVSVPLLFLISILPDLDLLIPGLRHRGLTHSLIILGLFFLPALMTYGKGAIPYFLAWAQHSLVGDYLTGQGVQLFWPLNTTWYGGGIALTGVMNVSLEWIFFLTCLAVMLKTRDILILLKPHPSNLLLSVPALTVFLPLLFSRYMPFPLALIPPHLTLLTLFVLSILVDFKKYALTQQI